MRPLVIDARAWRADGGVGRYTREIVPGLLAECAEHHLPVRVLVPEGAPPDELAMSAGADVDVVPSRAAWMDAASEAVWLPRETRDASCVHSLSGHWAPEQGLSLVTVHDLTPSARPGLTTAEARFRGDRAVEAARRATVRLAVCRTVGDDLRRLLGAAALPLMVIPQAAASRFHDARPDAAVARRYGVTPGGYLFAIGAGRAHKNIRGLLEAYLASGVSTPLLLAGPLPADAHDINRLRMQPGAARRILMAGPVPDADLAALYAGCRMFVSASLGAGFGLAVLEAMAAGAPVVATRSSSAPDVTGEAACWVAPGDTAELARALAEVEGDPARRTDLARRGRLRAAQYSWSRTASMTVGAYIAIALARAA